MATTSLTFARRAPAKTPEIQRCDLFHKANPCQNPAVCVENDLHLCADHRQRFVDVISGHWRATRPAARPPRRRATSGGARLTPPLTPALAAT